MPHPVPEGERPAPDERATFRRSDFALLRRGARAAWGVPDVLKNEAVFQAAKVLARKKSTARERLAAMRFLVAADRADLLAARQGGDVTDGDGVRPRLTIPEADDRLGTEPEPRPEG